MIIVTAIIAQGARTPGPPTNIRYLFATTPCVRIKLFSIFKRNMCARDLCVSTHTARRLCGKWWARDFPRSVWFCRRHRQHREPIGCTRAVAVALDVIFVYKQWHTRDIMREYSIERWCVSVFVKCILLFWYWCDFPVNRGCNAS